MGNDGRQSDLIVIGTGLAGLVATCEALDAGLCVTLLDQENENNLGGQAHWSFGGLFLVDSPEQRRLRVKDSFDLAWSDWQGSAQFDRLDDEDYWAARWARAYVEFAAGEKRDWIRAQGIELTPVVGWAERGDGRADGHGNSVPRFHVAWGTGTGVSNPFVDKVRAAMGEGKVQVFHRHRATDLIMHNGSVTGVRGEILRPDHALRGVSSNREVSGKFELSSNAVLLATGGIGGNHQLVRKFWPERLGTPPRNMLTGVPAYVDGSGLELAQAAGARLVNRDRMWHYTEGIKNWDPVWPNHGIRILPGPSSLWFDALGNRLGSPALPGHDTIGTLKKLRSGIDTGVVDHSWFILNQRIIEKEFALSGSEQNPDLTNWDKKGVITERIFGKGAPGPVADFMHHGEDFVVAANLAELVAGMNELEPNFHLDPEKISEQIRSRDLQVENPFSKDQQIQSIRNARRYLGDRITRAVAPHRMLDPKAGPLIAVRLHTLTRKSLGGIQTDLSGRVLDLHGLPVDGLYAAGEVSGFGGGGMHGYNALEGTFLGGCLFSGRQAGRSISNS